MEPVEDFVIHGQGKTALEDSEMISIIVPIYNTKEEYIDECVKSILNQTYRNLEILLVDDGSDMVIARYLDRLTQTLSNRRVKVFHRENAGANRAREFGFKKSTGEWIVFLDDDDLLDINFITKMLVACKENRTDMAICEFLQFSEVVETTKTNPEEALVECYTFDKVEITRGSLGGYPNMRAWNGPVWGKIYRRSVLEKIDWDLQDYALTEDEFMSIQTSSLTDGLSFVQEQLYFYRKNDDGKEHNIPKLNRYCSKNIPMLRTVADIYIKFDQVMTRNHIKYSKTSLLNFYMFWLVQRASDISVDNKLDIKNKKELQRQASIFLIVVQRDKDADENLRIQTILLLVDSELFFAYKERSTCKDCKSSQSSSEFANNPGIRHSVRLLVSSVKNKLRPRTRAKNAMDKLKNMLSTDDN